MSGGDWTVIDRQVPVIITLTQQHVVWIDVAAEEDAARTVECYKDDPYDLFQGLNEKNAADLGYDLDYDPAHHLLQQDWHGPYFASGAMFTAEEERYQEYLRSPPRPTVDVEAVA